MDQRCDCINDIEWHDAVKICQTAGNHRWIGIKQPQQLRRKGHDQHDQHHIHHKRQLQSLFNAYVDPILLSRPNVLPNKGHHRNGEALDGQRGEHIDLACRVKARNERWFAAIDYHLNHDDSGCKKHLLQAERKPYRANIFHGMPTCPAALHFPDIVSEYVSRAQNTRRELCKYSGYRYADHTKLHSCNKQDIETEEERREVIWHEIKTSHIAGRILTGTLDGVEQTPSGRTIVVVDYKGYRIAIPLKEMMLYSGPVPYGAKYKPFMERMNSILATMLTAEIDFIVRGLDNTARSVVASRKAAMLRKRQTFYLDANEDGVPMIYEGRVVQARVIGVAEKVLRVEVFGVECTIFARDLSAAWFGDAREYYSVGDRVLVRVLTIDRSDINHISITADIRSVSSAANQSNLDKCVLQGKYAGRVTDVRHGVVFIRLNNGVNAVAHTCYDRRMPGKKDDVSFAVTRLDEERGIAVGIITRIIKQNL